MSKGYACHEGNVFIDGKATCGSKNSWTSFIQHAICKELGFPGALTLTVDDMKRKEILTR